MEKSHISHVSLYSWGIVCGLDFSHETVPIHSLFLALLFSVSSFLRHGLPRVLVWSIGSGLKCEKDAVRETAQQTFRVSDALSSLSGASAAPSELGSSFSFLESNDADLDFVTK